MGRISNDDKIINDNPGLSPYEYLMKGVSQSKVAELEAAERKEVQQNTQKVKPVVSQDNTPRAVGITMQPAVEVDRSAMAYLVDTQEDKSLYMSRVQAEKFVNKSKYNRKRYSVI